MVWGLLSQEKELADQLPYLVWVLRTLLSFLLQRAKKVLHTGTHYFLPIFLFNPVGLAEALGGSDVS